MCAAEVKRLKVQKLQIKDDALRLRKAAEAAAEARMLGEGSFGRVFLGRDAVTRADVAIKVEDLASASAAAREIDLRDGNDDDDDDDDQDNGGGEGGNEKRVGGGGRKSGEKMWDSSASWDYGSWEEDVDGDRDEDGEGRGCGSCGGGGGGLNGQTVRGGSLTPLELEHTAMTRVTRISGPAGFPRVHFFGEQRVFGRPSRVLVMDLLGPSLEDMSWAVSAGGPLSATTTLMVADQALARIAAVHRAGVVGSSLLVLDTAVHEVLHAVYPHITVQTVSLVDYKKRCHLRGFVKEKEKHF